MKDIQFQVVARVCNGYFNIQITSGVDILIEEHYRLATDSPDKSTVRVEILKAFNHALEVKLGEAIQ